MFRCFKCRSRPGTSSNVLTGFASSDTGISEEQSSINMAALEGHPDHSVDERAEETGSTNRVTKILRASICVKLTVFICLLVMVASGLPALVLWLKAHEQLVEQIERRLLTVSTLRQEQLKEYLIGGTDKLKLISTRILINNYLANKDRGNKTLAEYDLKAAVGVITDFQEAAIYDGEGNLAISTDVTVFDNKLQPKVLASMAADQPKFSLPVYTSSGWIYNMSRPIYKGNLLAGVLMALVNATKLAGLVYDSTGLQSTGELMVGVPNGTKDVRLLFPPLNSPNVTTVPYGSALTKAINGESGIMQQKDYNGVKVIAAYRPVEFLSWGLLAKLEVGEAYAPVRSVRFVIVITIAVLLFVGVLASLSLAQIFTSPIIELGRAAAALGQGDMRTRVKHGRPIFQDEISDLMDTFDSMAQQIANHHNILEHKVRERTSDLARANDGLAKEIEERRRIELELEKAKDAALAANRSKSEFLANMSHEIRTPLNAIINFTEICLDTQITPQQQEHLDYVRFAAQHLLRLITDILDFSKIEAGKLEMEEIQFSLFEQLEHAVSVLAARALKNGLELCCSFDADVPDQIMGDPGRLLQIFVNLIGNGIKFTRHGEIVVTVSTKSKTKDTVELLFAVKDTGLGIPQSKQSLLFQAFSQVDSSTQRVYGGTGLGLVISSKLAAAMGGKMWVESDGLVDHGSTFWFTARFHVPPSCNLLVTSRIDLFKGVHALVVDDNPTSQKNLVDILQNWGMVAQGAGNTGAAECVLQTAAEAAQKYNVVLLDMWLNGDDISELLNFLREMPHLLERHHSSSMRADKPFASPSTSYSANDVLSAVIMLTSVNHVDATRSKELGITIHTPKPVKRSLLVKALQTALGIQNHSVYEARVSQGSDRPSRSLHILVAEDNVVNQRVAVILLEKWGHTAVLARNGEEAIDKAANEQFDLILMDVQMPICDGFEATSKIRERERIQNRKSTPIVAMTAHAMSGDGERCIAAGMDFYISKPLNAKKLQELLQNVAAGNVNQQSVTSTRSLLSVP